MEYRIVEWGQGIICKPTGKKTYKTLTGFKKYITKMKNDGYMIAGQEGKVYIRIYNDHAIIWMTCYLWDEKRKNESYRC